MLMRYDPFRELDRFTDQFFGNQARTPWMPMDAIRHGNALEVRFDLPGVSPESIECTVERNVLTVKAERSWWPGEGDEVLARERPQGTYTRQILLGDALDAEHIDANYEHGVLTVTIPVAERAKPRKVEVHGAREAVEVGAAAS
ncbi:MAG: Hsp20/alpha crystallin family protein [Actinobacteria bacterium]|nr:Hsp20/alpha crystallin family protein [Actinomycetota bacterium]